jgi:hypothetical protein
MALRNGYMLIIVCIVSGTLVHALVPRLESQRDPLDGLDVEQGLANLKQRQSDLRRVR